ncbi:LPXTG cell wall anchor domain-containing protein, partial [Enterococcus faecalis]
MMSMKSKGSLLVTLSILLTVGIGRLTVSSEIFGQEVGQT